MDENKPRQSLPRFGIRDVLWAMVVLGLALGWWAESRNRWSSMHPHWRFLHENGYMWRAMKRIEIIYTNDEIRSHSFSVEIDQHAEPEGKPTAPAAEN
jgi:hypothetical protein